MLKTHILAKIHRQECPAPPFRTGHLGGNVNAPGTLLRNFPS